MNDSIEFPGELLTHPVSMTILHTAQSIDLYLLARSRKDNPSRPYHWIQSGYASVSSIIHSYSALESVVNMAGHQMFFEEESPLFVPPQRRSYTLKRVVASWKNTTCIDKLNIVAEQVPDVTVPDNLSAELRELNNLRNWIVHGFVYRSTVLLEAKPEEPGVYTVIDREDSVDWRVRFPNTKFHALDQLDATDARKGLIIALKVILLVHAILNTPLTMTSYFYGPYYTIVTDLSLGADEVLDSYIEEASNRSVE